LITVGVKQSGYRWIEAALQLSSEIDIANWRNKTIKNLKNFCSEVFFNV